MVASSLIGTAQATVDAGQVVSTNPVDRTPRVTANSAGSLVTVYKMLQVGDTMFAGGEFTEVQDYARTATYPRRNLFSFDVRSGAVSPLAVNVNGAVWAIASDGTSLYIGGTFTEVNGIPRRGLAKLDPATGVVDPAFRTPLTGSVRDAEVVAGRLIIAGEFTKRLAAVNLSTGADTGYIDLAIAGDVDGAGGWDPRVYRFSVDPTATHLIGVGNFLTVSGQSRPRALMVDLGPTRATLDPWHYDPLGRACRGLGTLDYLRDVAFSPDGSWFAFVGSGWVPSLDSEIGTSICDAAARFETANTAPVAPTWINYTGGDTLHSVVVTDAAVYAQGHQRWFNNPYGVDSCGPGCISRPGIGALNPATGAVLPWNPTKDRGEGGKDLLFTSQGLWVPSDTTVIGHEVHERIALLPLR